MLSALKWKRSCQSVVEKQGIWDQSSLVVRVQSVFKLSCEKDGRCFVILTAVLSRLVTQASKIPLLPSFSGQYPEVVFKSTDVRSLHLTREKKNNHKLELKYYRSRQGWAHTQSEHSLKCVSSNSRQSKWHLASNWSLDGFNTSANFHAVIM